MAADTGAPFQLPEGAKVREKQASEFWPTRTGKIGEVVVGRIASFNDERRGDDTRTNFSLEPVIHYPKGEPPSAYAELKLSYNSWLKKLISRGDVGQFVAISYKGERDTPNGKMFTYGVADYPEAEFKKLLAQLAPGLVIERLPASTTAEHRSSQAGPGLDDDVPF